MTASSTPRTDAAARALAVERARKLHKLAKGTDFAPEAKAATSQLARLLDEYGLTLADLDDPQAGRPQRTEEVAFKVRTDNERQLAAHIFATVTDEWQPPVQYRRTSTRARTGYYVAQLPPYPAALARAMWRAYVPALEKHVELAVAAFMNAHRLFPPTAPRPVLPGTGQQDGGGSDPDMEAIAHMARGAQRVDLNFNELGAPERAALPAGQ